MKNEDARFLEAWGMLDGSLNHEEHNSSFEEIRSWGLSDEKVSALVAKYLSGRVEISSLFNEVDEDAWED